MTDPVSYPHPKTALKIVPVRQTVEVPHDYGILMNETQKRDSAFLFTTQIV